MHTKKLAILFAILPLAGCETLGLSSPPPAYPDQTGAVTAAATGPTIVAEPCPQSAVLSETSKMIVMRGTGTAAGDIMLTAEISPPKLECDYDPSTRVDNIDLNFPIILTKGPAFAGDKTQITYFIALVNNAGEVIAKKQYQRSVDFEGKQSFIATEAVDNLVLTLGPGTVPVDHRILIGFQLTPAQLAYNRAKNAVPAPAPEPTPAAAPAPARATAPTTRTRGRRGKPVTGPTTATVAPPATTTTAPAAATAPAPAPATAPAVTPAATPAPASGTTPAATGGSTTAAAAVPGAAPQTADDGVTRATLPSPYPDDGPDTDAAPSAPAAAPADQPAPAAATTTTPAATPPAATPPAGQ